jgi:hypothetical protein
MQLLEVRRTDDTTEVVQLGVVGAVEHTKLLAVAKIGNAAQTAALGQEVFQVWCAGEARLPMPEIRFRKHPLPRDIRNGAAQPPSASHSFSYLAVAVATHRPEH